AHAVHQRRRGAPVGGNGIGAGPALPAVQSPAVQSVAVSWRFGTGRRGHHRTPGRGLRLCARRRPALRPQSLRARPRRCRRDQRAVLSRPVRLSCRLPAHYHAILAGRIRWGVLLFLLLGLYAAVGGAEYASGHVVVWLQDMLLRAQADGERLALAYLRELSVEFRLIAAAIVLAVVLFWLERRRLSAQYEESRMYHGAIRALNGWFNAPAPWLASAILAALLLDPLCVGGHGAIVLWPALWRIIEETPAQPARRRLAVLALAGAVALPAVTGLLHGAARSALALPASLPVPFEHLGRLGNVLATPEQSQRAAILAGHHARHRRAYMDLAEAGASDLHRALDPAPKPAWLGEPDRLAAA